MRVFRHTYSRSGCQRKVARWYVELRFDGKRWRFPGFTDRRATTGLALQLERLASLRAVGDLPDPLLARAIERWPASLRERCAALGLLARSRAAGMRPLSELIDEFEAHLRARDLSERHVATTVAYARRLVEGCGFRVWSEITATAVERYLRTLREGGLATRTTNHQLACLRQFCHWAVEHGLAQDDPLRTTRKLNASVDPRRQRRSLKDAELVALIEATRRAPPRDGLSGERRALLYAFAAQTGLRANEIASLRVGSFALDDREPHVTVSAAASKRRREDVLPLRPDLVRALGPLLEGRKALERAFAVPARFRPAEALREDLALAEIPFADDEGRVFDFHSFRVQFVSSLVRAGVDPRTVQRLARHSTPNLTLGVYTRLGRDAERTALDRLPCLGSSLGSEGAASEQRLAAGGEGAPRGRPPGGRTRGGAARHGRPPLDSRRRRTDSAEEPK